MIHHWVSPPFFMCKMLRMKLPIVQVHSDYFMRLGNTALSYYGDALGAGEKPPRTSSN